MDRRNILKRIGAVSAATLTAGMASASKTDDGSVEMRVYLPDQDETVTIQDDGDCICYDGCDNCDCPSECDACMC